MASSADIRAGAAYVELSVDNAALVRGLKAAQRRLKSFAASVSDVGRRMVLASGVMAAPFLAGVKVFAEFEQQMANVSTMLAEPGKHLPGFREELRDMSIEFGESTETLAKGLYDILSASVPAEQALAVLAASARAAKAGLTDTGTAADAITTILNAYGLGAERAGDVSDWLFSVVRKGKATFADLAPNVGKVATIAAAAGIGLDELGAAIATLTRAGVRTEQSMTAVAAIVAGFLKPGAESAAAARRMGFELSAATLAGEGLHGVLGRLAALPPDALAKVFPNVEALRGVLPALRNLAGFGADLEAMRNRAGATGEAYGRMTGTLAHGFARLRQAALAVLSVLGEALAEPVAKAAGTITRLAGNLRGLIRSNRGLVVAAAKAAATVAAVGGALVGAGTAAGVLAFALGGLSSVAAAVGTTIGAIGSVLGALLTPVALVTGAAAALGGALVHVSGTGGAALAWLAGQFAWLREVARESFKGIGEALAAGDIALAARVLWLSLKVVFQEGANGLLGLWLDLKNGILNAWIGVKAGLVKTWRTLWFALQETAIRNGIAGPLLEGFHLVESGWLAVTQAMARMWMELVGLIFKAWSRVQSGLLTAQQWIGRIAIDVMGYFDRDLDTAAAKTLLRDDHAEQRQRLAGEAESVESGFNADRREMARRHAAEAGELAGRQGARKAEMERREAIGDRGRLAEMQQAHHEVDTAAEAGRNGVDRQAAADLKAAAEALEKARAEWKAAIAEAGRRRGAAPADGPAASEDGRIDALIDRLRAAAGAPAGGRIEVKGTFDLAGLRALAAAGASDSVAANTAEMVRQQKRTNRKLDDRSASGLAFL